MTPKVQRTPSPYQQIAQDIATRIRSGEYPEGMPIPSARQIATEWNVALATATKVHAQLRLDGLVEPVPGVGTLARKPPADNGGQGLGRQLRATGRVYAADGHAKVVSSELVAAPEDIAVALGVGAGTEVVRRERVSFDGDVPTSMSVSWLPGAMAQDAPALLSTERILEGTFAYLARCCGREVTHGRDEVSAGEATAAEAAALGVKRRAAVLRARTWFLDAEGEVIEYGESVRRGGLWSSQEYSMP